MPKASGMLDYLTFRELVRDVEDSITGQWMRRIFQPHPQEIAVHFGKGKTLVLSLEPQWANIRFDEKPEKRLNTPFLLLARKHLEDRKVESFRLIEGEKIAILWTRDSGLVIELPGVRNRLLLLNEKKEIVAVFLQRKITEKDDRSFSKGDLYVPPDRQAFHLWLSPLENIESDWARIYSGDDKRWWGFNKLHWHVLRLYPEQEALRSFVNLRNSERVMPSFISLDKGLEGVSLIPRPGEAPSFRDASVLDVVSRFYSRRLFYLSLETARKRCLAQIDQSLEKKKKKQNAQSLVHQEAEHGEKWKIYGDILLSAVSKIEPRQETFTMPETGESIPLDPRYDAVRNAQNYYKRYKKAKQAVTALDRELGQLAAEIATLEELETWTQLAESEETLEWIESQLEAPGGRSPKEKIKKKLTHRCLRIHKDGYTLLVGRNAPENADVLRQAGKEDFWFHAKGIPGGHVAIRIEEKEPPESVMLEAARLAAYYSKGREWDKVPVDFTLRKDVRSIPGQEAHVTYRNQKTILVEPAASTGIPLTKAGADKGKGPAARI